MELKGLNFGPVIMTYAFACLAVYLALQVLRYVILPGANATLLR